MRRTFTLAAGSLILVGGLTGCADDVDTALEASTATTATASSTPGEPEEFCYTRQAPNGSSLGIHPVIGTATSLDTPASSQAGRVVEDQDTFLEIGPPAIDNDDLESACAIPGYPDSSAWVVTVNFNSNGERAFDQLSSQAACAEGDQRRIAVVVDDSVVTSPSVDIACGASMTSGVQITGDFGESDAKELASAIAPDH